MVSEITATAPDGPAAEKRTKPRKPWVAGLLSGICQGLGHIYGGRFWLGVGIHFLPTIVFSASMAAVVVTDAPVLASLILLGVLALAVYVFQIVWAVKNARAAGDGYEPKRYNHVAFYIGFVLVMAIVSESRMVKVFIVEAFKIPGGSMLPTLEVGDQIFVTKIGARNTNPERGDLVAFRTPVPSGEEYIKRLVALGGDEIAVKDGEVIINGNPIPRKQLESATFWDRGPSGQWESFEAMVFEESLGKEPYRVLKDPNARYGSPDFGPITVPEGHFFVLGDHRDQSMDSRMWGPVPMDNLVGRAQSIWWSWGKDGFRGERIRQRL